jgi:hypothetical protein
VILQDEAEARADTRDIVTRDDIKRLEKNLLKKKEREKAEVIYFFTFFFVSCFGKDMARHFRNETLDICLALVFYSVATVQAEARDRGEVSPTKKKKSDKPASSPG